MPQLVTVSSTARDIQALLRCVSFASRALVQISEQGLRFTVEEARAMQGELGYYLLQPHVLMLNRSCCPR